MVLLDQRRLLGVCWNLIGSPLPHLEAAIDQIRDELCAGNCLLRAGQGGEQGEHLCQEQQERHYDFIILCLSKSTGLQEPFASQP